jgi:oligopeptide transport system ATP-binding protein
VDPILRVENLKVHFPVTQGVLFKRQVGTVKAVDGVSFTLNRGETLGLVGESGCGKSTTGLAIMKMLPASDGRILFDGEDLAGFKGQRQKQFRRTVQMVYQDPFASLNPRMKVRDLIAEPLEVHGMAGDRQAVQTRVSELLDMVGLLPYMADRYPHEFSGGQRQRIGIARALALEPSLIVCDEPVSALDVSIQAQVVNVFMELQRTLGLSYLFIAHDLAVVRHISDRVAVMYLGRIVEIATRRQLYASPLHPYTRAVVGRASRRCGDRATAPANRTERRSAEPDESALRLPLPHAARWRCRNATATTRRCATEATGRWLPVTWPSKWRWVGGLSGDWPAWPGFSATTPPSSGARTGQRHCRRRHRAPSGGVPRPH